VRHKSDKYSPGHVSCDIKVTSIPQGMFGAT
jgi:hypothetical protein